MPVRRLVVTAGLAAITAFALPPSPSYAAGPTDVYVAVPADGGNDTNDCTFGSPCATVSAAVAAVADGGTIHVGTGTFSSQVDIAKSLAIVGAGAGQTTLTAPQDSGFGYDVGISAGTTTLSDLTIHAGLYVDVLVYGSGAVTAHNVVLADAGCNLQVAAGSASLTDSTVQNGGQPGCPSTGLGQPALAGEVVVTGGTVSLTRTRLLDAAPGDPAVQLVSGALTVDQSLFDDSGRDLDTNNSFGVKVSAGTATIARSTFHGWGAAGVGGQGGVGGDTTVGDSTFEENIVGVIGGTGTMSVVRSTFERGLSSLAGTISVAGSVLGSMDGTPAIGIQECQNFSTITDLGYNLSSDTSCGFADQHSVQNVGNLHLDTGLADRGGPVPTVAVLWPTPAADLIPAAATYGPSATPLCTGTTDLRGVPRPQAGACDAGSMEMVATATSLTAPTTAKPHAEVLLQAAVSVANVGIDGVGDLAGSVTFRSGTTVLCHDVALTGGAAQCLTTALAAGSRPVKATFTPVDTSTLHASVSATRTIKVGTMPAFTSSSRVTFVVGKAQTFRVRAAGSPSPRVTLVKGKMPAGLVFKAGTGTATISGKARASAVGGHVVTVQATNLRGSVRQVLTIVVSRH